MAKFDLNDDGLVVIIGSGAGGGTLGNELAQKGVKAVILEAGDRHELQDFVNDEWNSFTQLAWTDMRTTSGSWQVARDFPNLPAWIVKSVGGSTVHWAGASLRFDEHEFKIKTVYGDIGGANLLDWPITLAEMEPWYAKAEFKMGTTRTNGIPGLPGSNNFKVMEAGARKLGYTQVHTGRMSINSQPRDGRGSCQQIGFCFQGCKSGAKWSTLYTEIPQGRGDRQSRGPARRAWRCGSSTTPPARSTASSMSTATASSSGRRPGSLRWPAIRSKRPRLLLNSRLQHVSERARQQLRAGRPQLHAAHDRQRLRRASTSRCTCTAARRWPGIIMDEAHHDPKRGFGGGYEMETLSLGLPFMAAFLNPGAWGRELHDRDRRLSQHGRHVAGRRGHAAGDQPRHARSDRPRMPTECRSPACTIDDHPNDVAMRNHAYQQGRGGLRGGRRDAHVPDAALSQHAQSRHQPDERKAA